MKTTAQLDMPSILNRFSALVPVWVPSVTGETYTATFYLQHCATPQRLLVRMIDSDRAAISAEWPRDSRGCSDYLNADYMRDEITVSLYRSAESIGNDITRRLIVPYCEKYETAREAASKSDREIAGRKQAAELLVSKFGGRCTRTDSASGEWGTYSGGKGVYSLHLNYDGSAGTLKTHGLPMPKLIRILEIMAEGEDGED